jgi:hypothetical protein
MPVIDSSRKHENTFVVEKLSAEAIDTVGT